MTDSDRASGRSEGRISWFERNPIKTGVGLVAIFLVGTLSLTEWLLTPSGDKTEIKGLARILVPPRFLIMREWRPNSVYTYRAPAARYNDPLGPVDDVYTVSIDAQGFIEPSIKHASPDFEIAFLGGSTTECLYIRPDDRFPARVGQILEQRTGRKINVLNAAKSANNTMHSLLNYIAKVAPRRPRYAVLMHAINDMVILSQYKTYWNGYKNRALIRNRDRRFKQLRRDIWAKTIPYTYSALDRGFLVLKLKLTSLFGRQPLKARPGRAQVAEGAKEKGGAKKPPAPSEQELERRELFRRYYEPALRSFVRAAKAWQSRPVLMTQVLVDEKVGKYGAMEGDMLPLEELRRGKFDRAGFGSFHGYANAIIRHVAHSEGALLIDIAAARRWTADDVYDAIHLTTTGSKRMAAIIADALEADLKRSHHAGRTAVRHEGLKRAAGVTGVEPRP